MRYFMFPVFTSVMSASLVNVRRISDTSFFMVVGFLRRW